MRPRVLWVNLKSCQIPSLFHCHCQWLRASKHMKVSWPDQQLRLFLGHWETTFRSEEVMEWPGWRCVKTSFAFGWMSAFVRFAFFWAFFYRLSACHALCKIHVPLQCKWSQSHTLLCKTPHNGCHLKSWEVFGLSSARDKIVSQSRPPCSLINGNDVFCITDWMQSL